VDHRAAQRALGGAVGRLDAVQGGEGPQRGPDLEQVVGESAVVAGACALARGVFDQLAQFVLDRVDVGLQPGVVVVVVVVGAPALNPEPLFRLAVQPKCWL
jgi:hypothetical protein